MGWNCNSIEWLVDILGTIELLSKVGGDCAVHLLDRGSTTAIFRASVKRGDEGDCLYFQQGHWHSVKGTSDRDSYSADYQISGTAHFCQTFAVMMHIGATAGLEKGKYKNNVAAAVDFWLNIVKNEKDVADMIVREIKTSKWASDGVETEDPKFKLKTMTRKNLETFLTYVYQQALGGTFTGCKEG